MNKIRRASSFTFSKNQGARSAYVIVLRAENGKNRVSEDISRS
jgi:hypothetical protein